MNEYAEIEKIIQACKQGDNEAFAQLVDIYAKRCFGYFYRLTGNAEVSNDLLSELFVKLVEKIRSFKGGAFEKWLFTIASNVFRDYLRRQYRQKKLLEAKASELTAETPARRADIEMQDRLQIQLARLDDDTRELLMLRFYGQLSFRELAAMRKEPIGTTLAKVHRGLKKLRELMEGHKSK